MIKAIIFDMDGVIVDTEKVHDKADNIVLKRFNAKLDEEDYIYGMGRGAKEVWTHLKEKYNLPPSIEKLIAERRENYFEMLKKELKPIDGAIELVKAFKKRNTKIGLATSSSVKEIKIILNKLNIAKYFEITNSAENVANSKPAPDIFLKTAKDLNEKPKNCVVIEDTFNGVKAARRAGMKCIALKSNYTTEEDLKEANLIVNSLKEINIDQILSW